MSKTTILEPVNRTLTGWNKSEISLLNYQRYILKKADKFRLGLIDLLYVSNFKGGNATINVEETLLNEKLMHYSEVFRQIEKRFCARELRDLSMAELEELTALVKSVLLLTGKAETAIDGFKSSYLSALIHSYFPLLIPILDRRLLVNLGIVNESNIIYGGQVRKIEGFYEALITKIYQLSNATGSSVRSLDKKYFIIKLPDWAK